MFLASIKLRLILVLILCQYSDSVGYRFYRTILHVGYPYYKILMSLGTCKDATQDLIFTDQKIWGKVPLNRVLDIYYKSGDSGISVTRVEILLVLNNTNVIGYSEAGVGYDEFTGALYLPMNVGFIVYQLAIFNCQPNREPSIARSSPSTDTDTDSATDSGHRYLPFYLDDKPIIVSK
ncbi:uncharacterized protein LOC142981300 [Anticarsia gemmatalis]|uniref:uncharacterized protein LOC142981300 n=1 Tax=Anticarsia gemmatalis TaxID=129554 RepID=UPI003F771CCF